MCLANHLGRTSHVVEMRLAIEENLGIFPAEAELLNACAYLRRRSFEVRVDQDVSLRGYDEVAGKVLASHVVEVVGDSEWSDGCRPLGVCFSVDKYRRAEKEK